MERSAHIISHTHWDREWFLPARYVREWLPPFFEALFAIMEQDSDYRFVLDGQMVMIEDCLRQYDPQQRAEFQARLGRYVGEGRLIIGPYYLQPDWHIPSDEALIRNIEIGMEAARRYGARPRFGWLLDNFGQISQAPQLHCGFGIESLFLWRGVDLPPDTLSCEARWQGADGSEVLALLLLDSYRNAMRLLGEPDRLVERLQEATARIAPFSGSGHLLLMNGYDQETDPENPLPFLKTLQMPDMKVVQSTPEEYAAAISDWGSKTGRDLPLLHGAQRLGRYGAVFPGVLSARIYLKQQQRQCETLLVRYVEPLLLLSGLGHVMGMRARLKKLWRQILRNLPHDSICGVSVDPVHRNMERRSQSAEQQGLGILANCATALQWKADSHIDTQTDAVAYAIFRPGPRPFGEVIAVAEPSYDNRQAQKPAAFIEDAGRMQPLASQQAIDGNRYLYLPPSNTIGVQTIQFTPADEQATNNASEKATEQEPDGIHQPVSVSDGRMRNAFVEIGFAADGTIELHCLQSGRIYSGLHRFVDSGDAGDTYSYSPPLNDRVIEIDENDPSTLSFIEQGPLLARARIQLSLQVPECLTAHRCRRSHKMVTLPITTEVVLCAGSPLVRFYTIVENRACDHRLQVHFPTDCHTTHAIVSAPFGAMPTNFEPRVHSDADLSPEVHRLLLGAREPTPDGFVPCSGYVDVADDRGGLALINPELPEIELVPERRTVALTLLRAVGWLARSDLATRVGDAGPHIAVPDAQCQRRLSYVYALYPYSYHSHDENAKTPQVACAAAELAAPSLWWRIPSDWSVPMRTLITLDAEPGVLLSSARAIDNGEELRFCNFGAIRRTARIQLEPDSHNPRLTRLDGTLQEEITPDQENGVNIELGAQAIVTLAIDSNRRGSSSPPTQPVLPQIGGLSPYEFSMPADEIPRSNAATIQWLRAERRRVAELHRSLKSMQLQIRRLTQQHPHQSTSIDNTVAQARAQSHLSTLQRQLYEARISVSLLAWGRSRGNRHNEPRRLVRRLRKLGLQLNQARIAKRSDDFKVALAEARSLQNNPK